MKKYTSIMYHFDKETDEWVVQLSNYGKFLSEGRDKDRLIAVKKAEDQLKKED